MWQYLEKHFRKEDISFPKSRRYKDEAAFQAEFQSTIKPLIAARKGIVAFDKIFGFGGTGAYRSVRRRDALGRSRLVSVRNAPDLVCRGPHCRAMTWKA